MLTDGLNISLLKLALFSDSSVPGKVPSFVQRVGGNSGWDLTSFLIKESLEVPSLLLCFCRNPLTGRRVGLTPYPFPLPDVEVLCKLVRGPLFQKPLLGRA